MVPLLGGRGVERRWLGWANALAAGLMLGVAFTLGVAEGGESGPAAIGALVGLLLVAGLHRSVGLERLELNRLDDVDPAYGYRVALVQTFHAGAEGVALGAAMAASVPFGLFTAATMAVHNVPEATILAAVQRARDLRLPISSLAAVAVNLPQAFLAVATWAVVDAVPSALPWTLGLAAGMLIQLVMVELLPESYRQTGHISIAIVTSVAMSAVALLMGWIVP